MKSSAPIASNSCRFSSIALAVTAMIFGALPPAAARIRRIASTPPMTGTRKAATIRWGVQDRREEVHQDQARPPVLEFADGLPPVSRRPDLKPDRGEELGQELAVVL